MRQLLPCVIAIAAMLDASVAFAAPSSWSITVFRSGAIQKQPATKSLAKDATFCNANPGVLLHLTQSISPAPDAQGQIQAPGAGAVSANFSVTLDAMCLAGQTTVRVDYGVLPGGTAVAGTDYASPGTASVTFANVPQYANAQTQAASLNLTIVSRSRQQPVTVPIGFAGGAFVNTQSDPTLPPLAGPIQADNVPLATIVIGAGLTAGQANNLLQGAAALDPVAAATAASFAQMCTTGKLSASLQGKCNAILAAAQTPAQAPAIANALRGVATEETSSQSESANQAQTAQLGNIGQRMSALRGGGGGGFSLNGLVLQRDGMGLPLDLNGALDAVAGESDKPAFATSRWGVFLNGSLGSTDRNRTGLEDGYNQDTTAITVGSDYRFSSEFVAGAAYTWSHIDGDLRSNSGKLDTHLKAVSLYANLDMHTWYAQVTVAAGPTDFRQTRTIQYAVPGDSENARANSDPGGRSRSGNLELGWYLSAGGWSLTPSLRADYQHVTIDSYAEQNGGDFDLSVDSQHETSLRYSAGVSATHSFNIPQGVLVPNFDLRLYREADNNSRAITSHFIADPSAVLYQVPTDSPDRFYGSATVGLQAIFPHGVQAYANYQRILGQQSYSIGLFNVGVRIEL